ncbi:hypothetical protein [Streptomyces sp. BV286]|nr:hypothetical protein [Streptomyces sp. BV286]
MVAHAVRRNRWVLWKSSRKEPPFKAGALAVFLLYAWWMTRH